MDRGLRVDVRGDRNRASSVAFRIERDGAVRHRRFDAVPTECEESHAVVALAIALAIDAEARRPRAAIDAAIPPRDAMATLQASAAYAVVAGASFGGKLGLELPLLSFLAVRTELVGHFSGDAVVADTRGSFSAGLFGGAASACGGGDVAQGVRVSMCTGVLAAGVFARGTGFSEPRAATSFLLGGLGGLRAEWRAGIPWILDLDMIAPIRGVSFRVERPGALPAVRHPEALGIMLSVGVGLDL